MIPEYLSPLANHLWQSTLFAVATGLLTVVLRKNRASLRYWLWLAASLKFLFPFSLLVRMGHQMEWRAVTEAAPAQIPVVVDQIGQAFVLPAVVSVPADLPLASDSGPVILLGIWLSGVLWVTFFWIRQWRQIRAAVRASSPIALDLPIPVLSTASRLEPGIFGILRPVLLVPKGLLDDLTPEQWKVILAHELCHVRRRDNLTAAIHMLVEAIFWFYPLVWWIGKRLVEERERACDEEVLMAANDPHVYAEGILKVCKVYLKSPLVCASGVSGSDLTKRIRAILLRPTGHKMDFARKLLLAAAGIAAIGGPIVFGLANASQGKAQSKAGGGSAVVFEVASVRPADRKAGEVGGLKGEDRSVQGPSFQLEHRRLTIRNFNLFALILHAYGIRGCRPMGGGSCALLSGGPEWLRKDAFDVLAKMPDHSPDDSLTLGQFQNGKAPQVQLMLQALLADRFQLKLHREMKQVPVYALTIGKKGPKLKKAEESEESKVIFRPLTQANGQEMIQLVVQNGSMHEVTELYAKFMDRPVLDRTGLKGKYDFTLHYEANADAPGPFAAVTGPALFRALQEQAGLKLEATKGAVEVLVIDHAEHPSEN